PNIPAESAFEFFLRGVELDLPADASAIGGRRRRGLRGIVDDAPVAEIQKRDPDQKRKRRACDPDHRLAADRCKLLQNAGRRFTLLNDLAELLPENRDDRGNRRRDRGERRHPARQEREQAAAFGDIEHAGDHEWLQLEESRDRQHNEIDRRNKSSVAAKLRFVAAMHDRSPNRPEKEPEQSYERE